MLSLLRPVIAGAVAVAVALIMLAQHFAFWPELVCHGTSPYGQHDYTCTFTFPGR